ncbi:hypothetical protein Bxe_A4549 [Paraburkholderia xenovorans LB400]|uniref:Uncharacterized protein n=1 Tax=Paraburkholderia xenovorans (strain LB400) TaxID=266265 RepID=Q13ZZ1_PARXL|nr:hypothetical protein Bxe_A4516 [Paraburkholderia xenovorans LB400]ABE30348.1 hypothetical protein Bxe_A4549 [Paraburkholderia xenovorans LB400]
MRDREKRDEHQSVGTPESWSYDDHRGQRAASQQACRSGCPASRRRPTCRTPKPNRLFGICTATRIVAPDE